MVIAYCERCRKTKSSHVRLRHYCAQAVLPERTGKASDVICLSASAVQPTNGRGALLHVDGGGDFIAPAVFTIPLQLLAYHVAVLRGTDVDQPRNLAKSVTVE